MTMHKALGRGLEALLQTGATAPTDRQTVAKIPVDKIRPNRHQPRRAFAEESLNELAESIKSHGLAQPLLVSASAVPGEYELIAGERRLRAAKRAGLTEVPCVIRAVTDRQRHELALVENIQREDLNPLEEAESMAQLMEAFHITQEDMARALGRSRPAVANKLRLLGLPELVKNSLREGLLSEGHARVILSVPDPAAQAEWGRRVVREGLTVRELERFVQGTQTAAEEPATPVVRKDPDVRRIEEELQQLLGRRVVLQSRGKDKGWVRLEFYSLDDLDALLKELKSRRG